MLVRFIHGLGDSLSKLLSIKLKISAACYIAGIFSVLDNGALGPPPVGPLSSYWSIIWSASGEIWFLGVVPTTPNVFRTLVLSRPLCISY